MEKISVIGNGALAMSIAAEVAIGGTEVTYIDCSSSPLQKTGITIRENGIVTPIQLKAYTAAFDSIANADIVMIGVTASHYDTVFTKAAPFIQNGQLIVFFPASFGAIRFKSLFKDRDLTICEVVSFPAVCEFDAKGYVNIQNRKSCLNAAVCPATHTEQVLSRLNVYFKIFEPAKNLLDTSLDNMNMTLHPLPVLLNLSSVETDAARFKHYVNGVTSTVGSLMEKLDAERLAIGSAYNLELTSAICQLKLYYGDNQAESIHDYVSSEDGPYPNVSGYGLNSRYIEEDIPNLLVPAISLAQMAGVETPVMDLCVQLASIIKDTDYLKNGMNLEKLGLADCHDAATLLQAVSR